MFSAKVLNSGASLNNFRYLTTLEFVPETQAKLAFRIFDTQLEERFVLPSTAIVTLTFNKTDGTTFDKIATVVDALDRSMFYVDLSEAETLDLLGGNLKFKIDMLGDATEIYKGLIISALSKIVLDC